MVKRGNKLLTLLLYSFYSFFFLSLYSSDTEIKLNIEMKIGNKISTVRDSKWKLLFTNNLFYISVTKTVKWSRHGGVPTF